MKIIYDEQKAILEKQQRDIEVPIINRKAKIYNTILAISTFLVVACIWVGWRAFIEHSAYAGNQWAFTIPVGIFTIICCGIAISLSKDTIQNYEKYSTNTKYYILVDSMKAIDHRLEYAHGGKYRLWITLEDESNHVVTERLLWPDTFTEQKRTDLSETIVDLENRMVYKPYTESPTLHN